MNTTDREKAFPNVSTQEAGKGQELLGQELLGQELLQRVERASPPVPPSLPRAALRVAEDRESYRQEREILERRSVLRGLILLVVLILVFAVLHGGAGRQFPPGWWRQW